MFFGMMMWMSLVVLFIFCKLMSPLHLGLYLLFLVFMASGLVSVSLSCVYSFVIILTMIGGVVVSFLFTAAIVEMHMFYSKNLMVNSNLVWSSSIFFFFFFD